MLMENNAVDMVNIKLMKCGGLHNAVRITSLAEIFGVECMIGCMLEGQVSVNAAVALAAGKAVITKIDLDTPLLCTEQPVIGGAQFIGPSIRTSDNPGLGFENMDAVTFE
jgi:L-alanine-DL-glutamate epimerase-like enolase superfamily enzyme